MLLGWTKTGLGGDEDRLRGSEGAKRGAGRVSHWYEPALAAADIAKDMSDD